MIREFHRGSLQSFGLQLWAEMVRLQMQKKYSFGVTILHSRIVQDMHEWKSYIENASYEGSFGPGMV